MLALFLLYHYQYYSTVSFVSGLSMKDTNIEILLIFRYYFKLSFKAADWLVVLFCFTAYQPFSSHLMPNQISNNSV